MRSFFVFCFLALVCLNSCNQGTKTVAEKKDTIVTSVNDVVGSDELEKVIMKFVKAYSEKNNVDANMLLDSDLGLLVIYRPGVADTFVKIDSIDFLKPVPSYFPYEHIHNDDVLQYAKLPEFNCGTEKWDKVGLYCDTTVHPIQLHTILDFEHEFEPNKYKISEIKQLKNNEEESVRVILSGASPLVFHVQKYMGQWYVVLLDRAYAGCDA